ncbi:hypothetical protein Taro_043062 [Colocasia esculenta]|uniref:Uncharacterized protein n=1 Tax=Colocasia esculenta TaxID=4460 RepID=A0A843WR55_COLES|nr:hypothetical protein [Colocasia esculenta]
MWRSSWQLGKQEIPTPSRSSSPLCLLRPAQTVFLKSTKGRALVSTLLEPVSTHCPSTAQKVSSVDTTWASVDTLSQIGQKVFWELSLVSTPPELVSTLLNLFALARRVSKGSNLAPMTASHRYTVNHVVTMKFKRKSKSRMGMHPSDERSNYESVYS